MNLYAKPDMLVVCMRLFEVESEVSRSTPHYSTLVETTLKRLHARNKPVSSFNSETRLTDSKTPPKPTQSHITVGGMKMPTLNVCHAEEQMLALRVSRLCTQVNDSTLAHSPQLYLAVTPSRGLCLVSQIEMRPKRSHQRLWSQQKLDVGP